MEKKNEAYQKAERAVPKRTPQSLTIGGPCVCFGYSCRLDWSFRVFVFQRDRALRRLITRPEVSGSYGRMLSGMFDLLTVTVRGVN
jgi:hypothetical protein